MKSHIVCSVARCSVISEKSQAIIAIRNDLRANSAVTNSKNAGHNNCRERWHRASSFRIASSRMTSKDRHPFFLSILSKEEERIFFGSEENDNEAYRKKLWTLDL